MKSYILVTYITIHLTMSTHTVLGRNVHGGTQIEFRSYPIGQIQLPVPLQKNEDLSTKVIGGSDAEPGEFPYQISLQAYDFNGGRYHTCGGSIIDANHVLTAAHCVLNKNLRNMEVVAGVHNIFQESENEQRREIARATIHPTYNPSSFDGDVAIVKLKLPFSLNFFVQPIRMASQTIEPSGKCQTTGWGNIVNDGSVINPEVLQKVELGIFPREECREYYGGMITKGMVCAGVPEGGKGSCHGDSGGPLICKDDNNMDYLAGDVSWGTNPCALEGFPSVYGNVAHYRDWIDEIISD